MKSPPQNSLPSSELLDHLKKYPPLLSDTWDEYTTKYIPGDLVRTEYGPAIILEADDGNQESYSVWPLPGWEWKKRVGGWEPVKRAWYRLDELELITWGPAHFLRPEST